MNSGAGNTGAVRNRLLAVLVVFLMFAVVFSGIGNARIWDHDECQKYCDEKGFNYLFIHTCEEKNCPSPQCYFQSSVLKDYCWSTRKDDGSEPKCVQREQENKADEPWCDSSDNKMNLCVKDANGQWKIDEKLCREGCHGSDDWCNDECETGSKKCMGNTAVVCKEIVFGGKKWRAWEPNFKEKKAIQGDCTGRCLNGACIECAIGDARCFGLENTESYEIRTCKKIDKDGRKVNAFVRDENTKLCTLGCENLIEKNDDGSIKTVRAECVKGKNLDCHEMCKKQAGMEYKPYAHGMCIQGNSCDAFASLDKEHPYEYALPLNSENAMGVCNKNDIYVVSEKALSSFTLFLNEMEDVWQSRTSSNVMPCSGVNVCHDAEGNAAEYMVVVSGSDDARRILADDLNRAVATDKMLALVRKLDPDEVASVYAQGSMAVETCCCAAPYRPLSKKKTAGEGSLEYTDKEKSEKKVASCELACWRKYNRKVLLTDLLDAYNQYKAKGGKDFKDFMGVNFGRCEKVSREKVKIAMKRGDMNPDVCSNAFLNYEKPYDYRLTEGYRDVLSDSAHCSPNDDENIDACCCRVYADSPAVTAALKELNKFKSFIENAKRKYNEMVDSIAKAIHSTGIKTEIVGSTLKIYAGKRAIARHERMYKKAIEQIKRDPSRIKFGFDKLLGVRKIDFMFDDGTGSYMTILADTPLIAGTTRGDITGSFHISGAMFSENWFAAVNAQPYSVIRKGDCQKKNVVQEDVIEGEYSYPIPDIWLYFDSNGNLKQSRGIDAGGITASVLEQDWGYRILKPVIDSRRTKPIAGGDLTIGEAIDKQKGRAEFFKTVEIPKLGSVYMARVRVPRVAKQTTEKVQKVPCSGSDSNFGMDITASYAVVLKPNYIFDDITPMVTASSVKGVSTLNLDVNMRKTFNNGKDELLLTLYGGTGFSQESISNGFGYSVRYEKNIRNGVPEFWYRLNTYDPVRNKYMGQQLAGAKWRALIARHLGKPKDKAKKGMNAELERFIDNAQRDMFYHGFLAKNTKDIEPFYVYNAGDQSTMVTYVGLKKYYKFNKEENGFLKGMLGAVFKGISIDVYGELVGISRDSYVLGSDKDNSLFVTLHGDVAGIFRNKKGYVRASVDLSTLPSNNIGKIDAVYQLGAWTFYGGLESALTDLSIRGYKVAASREILGAMVKLGAGMSNGVPYIIVGGDIPVGPPLLYATMAAKYAANLGWKWLWFDPKKSPKDIPAKESIGVPGAVESDKMAVRGYPNYKQKKLYTNVLDARVSLELLNAVHKYNAFETFNLKNCKSGCQDVSRYEPMCMSRFVKKAGLKDGDFVCSGNGTWLMKLEWPETYPFVAEKACDGGCVGKECMLSCDSTSKPKCTPDGWHSMVCKSECEDSICASKNYKYTPVFCDYGCNKDTGECNDVRCLNKCEDGDRRCSADGFGIEECSDGKWEPVDVSSKKKTCLLGCDPVNVRSKEIACYEDNRVLQQVCSSPISLTDPKTMRTYMPQEKRCSADGRYVQKCTGIKVTELVGDEVKTVEGYMYANEKSCELGCYGGRCIEDMPDIIEKYGIKAGAKACSFDARHVIEYADNGLGGIEMRVKECEKCDDMRNIEEGAMRCSSDRMYVQKYTSGAWKNVGEECEMGCDPIEKKCKEDVICSPDELRCSGDGTMLEKCAYPKASGATKLLKDAYGAVKKKFSDLWKKRPARLGGGGSSEEVVVLANKLDVGLVPVKRCNDGCGIIEGSAMCYEDAEVDSSEMYSKDSPVCSLDGMHSVRYADDGQGSRLVAEWCEFGCDPNTGECLPDGGCTVGATRCMNTNAQRCKEKSSNIFIEDFGRNKAQLQIAFSNIKKDASPVIAGVSCTDGVTNVYRIVQITSDNIKKSQWSTKLMLPINSRYLRPIALEEMREVKCDITMFSEAEYPVSKYKIPASGDQGIDAHDYFNYVRDKSSVNRVRVSGLYLRVQPNPSLDGKMRRVTLKKMQKDNKMAAMHSEDYCKEKQALDKRLCGHSEGMCKDDTQCGTYTMLSGRKVQLQCKDCPDCKGKKLWQYLVDEKLIGDAVKYCCLPWEEVQLVSYEKNIDGIKQTRYYPMCVPVSTYVGNEYSLKQEIFSQDYCKKKIAMTGEKCSRGEGDCDGEGTSKQCNEGLVCKDAPGGGWVSFSREKGPDLCCKPDEIVVYIDETLSVCTREPVKSCATEQARRCDGNTAQMCVKGRWVDMSYCDPEKAQYCDADSGYCARR